MPYNCSPNGERCFQKWHTWAQLQSESRCQAEAQTIEPRLIVDRSSGTSETMMASLAGEILLRVERCLVGLQPDGPPGKKKKKKSKKKKKKKKKKKHLFNAYK
ncbi:hypothetical protein OH492_22010 [Vibrio chagasii]|nr:hypothetical protein [Vibrio chagasii]